MAARFSPAHDAVVTTTVGGQAVTYKVSEHQVGGAATEDGQPVDVDQLEGLTEKRPACELCRPVKKPAPSSDAVEPR